MTLPADATDPPTMHSKGPSHPQLQNEYFLPFLIAAATGCLILLGGYWYACPIPQTWFGHDIPVLLEAAVKWQHGIYPNRDYFSSIGILPSFLIALGISASNGFLMAIPTAEAIFCLVAIPITLYVTFSRMRPWLAAITTGFIFASLISPNPVQCASTLLCYGGLYNRWGYYVFINIFLLLAISPKRDTFKNALVDGILIAALVIIGLLIKITYGALPILAIPVFLFANLRRPAFYFAAFIAGVSLLLFVTCAFHIDWLAYLRDMSLFSKYRQGLNLHGFSRGFFFISQNLCLFSALALTFYLARFKKDGFGNLKPYLRLAILTTAFPAFALLVIMTNAPDGDFPESPILCIGAIVLLTEFFPSDRSAPGISPLSNFDVSLLFAPFLALITIFVLQMKFSQNANAVTIRDQLPILGLILIPLAILAMIRFCRPMRTATIAAALFAGFVVIPALAHNLGTLAYAVHWKMAGATLDPNEVFSSGPLKGIQIASNAEEPMFPTTYVSGVEDGLNLIRSTGNSGRPVLTLEYANPFNVAQGITPPKGEPLSFQIEMTLSETSGPPAEKVFLGAELVMRAKNINADRQPLNSSIDRIYGDYIQQHFQLVGESATWRLYALKK